MKSGDKIEIIKSVSPNFYSNGDIATLKYFYDVHWWADFKGHDNKKVKGNGIWCIGTEKQFKLIKESEV